MIRAVVFILAFWACHAASFGQAVWPGPVIPYQQDEVASIFVTLPSDSLNEMIDNLDDSHYYPATFIYDSASLQDTLTSAGISLRGNTSLNAVKKSFKISFNEFDQGGAWQEVEQLNLIGQHNDPSLLRSKLCHDMHRFMGVPAARTSFVKLYINGDYRGLYLNQEHIDEEFAQKHFDGEGDGNLYKCTYPASLEYISNNPDDYKFANWGTRHYDLKTNEWLDDYSDLSFMIYYLTSTPLANMECEFTKYFDVDEFLRAAAVDVLLGNWDSYIFNQNNFYLYHNQNTNLFEYIPYDMDNTIGIDWVGIDWAERSIYSFAPSQQGRPLFKRLMQVETYRDRFTYYIQFLIDNYFNDTVMVPYAQSLQDLISDAALEDLYRTFDYGFDNYAFLNAIDSAWGDPHVDYGIAPFIEARIAHVNTELETVIDPGVMIDWLYVPMTAGAEDHYFEIQAAIHGTDADACELWLSTDNINFTAYDGFNDAGINGDITAGDGIYSFVSTQDFGADKLYYRLTGPGISSYPCTAAFTWLTPGTTTLYINEVMSANTNTISWDNIHYPDWLEIYNSSPAPQSLSYFLTDRLSNWNKYTTQGNTFPGSGFDLVWLDNEPENGDLHATFRLNAADAEIWLLSLENGKPRVRDHFTPCIAPADQSMERTTDGGTIIDLTTEPTPFMSNNPIAVIETSQPVVSLYPNPAQHIVQFSSLVHDLNVYTAIGELIYSGSRVQQFDISNWAAGCYVVRADDQVISLIRQ